MRVRSHCPPSAVAGLLLLLALTACGSDGPSGPGDAGLPIVWGFDNGDLGGWVTGQRTNELGGGEAGAAAGGVVLVGYGEPDQPNAWISRSIELPEGARTLRFDARAGCLPSDDGDSSVRVHLTDAGGGVAILLNWTTVDAGDPEPYGMSIEVYAGQTVTVFIEQDDEGQQENDLSEAETVCLDNIIITADALAT